MAENEKDVPVKELEDGSLIAKIDLPEEIEEEAPQKVEANEDSDEDDNVKKAQDADNDIDQVSHQTREQLSKSIWGGAFAPVKLN